MRCLVVELSTRLAAVRRIRRREGTGALSVAAVDLVEGWSVEQVSVVIDWMGVFDSPWCVVWGSLNTSDV